MSDANRDAQRPSYEELEERLAQRDARIGELEREIAELRARLDQTRGTVPGRRLRMGIASRRRTARSRRAVVCASARGASRAGRTGTRACIWRVGTWLMTMSGMSRRSVRGAVGI